MSFAPPLKDINQMTNGEMAAYGDDRKLMVTFSMEPVYQEFESKGGMLGGGMVNGIPVPGEMVPGKGRAIYKDMAFVEIVQPGSKSTFKRLVKLEDDEKGPSDPNRFPRQWGAFQNQQHQVSDGLPLEEWPPLGRAHIMAFKAAQIFTVEQLSNLPDSATQAIPVMDARKYRDMAAKYLEAAKGTAPVESLMQQMKAMQQQMEILQEQNAVLAANQKKTPGRKPGPTDEGE